MSDLSPAAAAPTDAPTGAAPDHPPAESPDQPPVEPLVIFTPSGIRGHVPRGTTVLSAARRLGVDLDSVCGERGICSKCQIEPGQGEFAKFGITVGADALSPRNAVEDRYDRMRGLKHGRRLGCQAQVQGNLVVNVPPGSQVHRQVVRKAASDREAVMDPATRLVYVEVREPDMMHPSSDLDRLRLALGEERGIEGVEVPPVLLPQLQPILRKGNWTVTAALHRDRKDGPERLVALYPGMREASLWGLAIDLGSTTIAAHLCDLATGHVEGSDGVMNPQIRFGEDLMSRVSYGMLNQGGPAELTSVVRDALDGLARNLAEEHGIDPRDILEVAVVCNPVMHHLLLGIDPVELGQAPFALAVSEALNLDAREIGLGSIAPAARAYLLPCIAGHVGADAAAVTLAEAPQESQDLVLIIDVGTNAEIQLGNTSRVLACSSPTGPAFEGGQISCGQRAAPGAIERVRIDPVTKEPRFRVIGCDVWSDDPGFERALSRAGLSAGITGICGSGIIEVVAEMRMAGILDTSGLIGSAQAVGTPRCIDEGRTHSYVLWDRSATGGPRIAVTQNDIRAVQLAKSALYAGARLLMDEFEVDKVDRVVLAGAFGAHISPLHALVLGMFPDCALEKITSAGNAAGTGARLALASLSARAQIEQVVHHIHKLETAVATRFQEHFVAGNGIPNRRDPYPELAREVTLPQVSFNVNAEATHRRRRRST